MLPLHLDWQRPIDGVEVVSDDGRALGAIIRTRSDRFAPVSYRVTNLENPVAVAFLNADDEPKMLAFMSRFGIPSVWNSDLTADPDDEHSAPLPNRITDGEIHQLRDMIEAVLAPADAVDMAHVGALNELLGGTSLSPSFEFSEESGRHRLAMRPTSLADLMAIECAIAVDTGAVLTRCAHCHKGFLTGPLTGRRGHATYCSDRCRVAAMRARNAAKGA